MTSLAEQQAATSLVYQQSLAQRLQRELPDLNFHDLPSVLRWLLTAAKIGDNPQVVGSYPWAEAVAVFESHGFEARDVELTPSVVESYREDVAHTIIAYALNVMKALKGFDTVAANKVTTYITAWFRTFEG